MKKNFSGLLLVFVFIIGLGVLLYPAISDYWNSRTQSQVIAGYQDLLASYEEEDYTEVFETARAYNTTLSVTEDGFYSPEIVEGYEDVLDITGTGVMGYVAIDKIDVRLPIYHGTSEGVLAVAVGHLEGSSLPIGGEGTHCVLSAHRGLPSAKLFSDLDEIVVGDVFTITVLNEVLTYQVDQIVIVLPYQVDELLAVEGEDLCTLMTCTPYGINTHRLLVRGHRVETAKQPPQIVVKPEAQMIDSLKVAPVVAAPMLFSLLVYMLIKYRKKN